MTEFLEQNVCYIFALLGPIMGLGVWAIGRRRLPDLPDADALLARYCLVLYALQSPFFLFWGLMQHLGGFDSFMYIITSRDHFNFFVLAPRVAVFGQSLALLWWIVLGGGAEKVAPYHILSGGATNSPFLLKMGTVLTIVGLTAMLIIFNVTGIFESAGTSDLTATGEGM